MSRSPNVIVFFTDQQRWDSTGLHGNPLDLTPNLDRVAREGTHVANSFTCQPVCGPARSALQTGLYPTSTGCFRNTIPLPEGQRTLADWFNDAGYHTGYIGKWHLASGDPVPANQRGGYQSWLASNVLEFTSEPYRMTMYDEDEEAVTLPGYRVDAQTDAAIRYVSDHRHEPFFLFCSYLEPHHQNRVDDYPAPDGYRQRYEGRWTPPDLLTLGGSSQQHLAGYWGMVKRLDEAYGRLLDALKSLDLLDDTIVLFTSDHGCHFKTRNAEYKRSCHDASIRVPTVFTGPGFDGGGHVRGLVSLIDLPPTLLDAAGIPVPQEMQGRSILPLLHGGKPDAWQREVFIQISEAEVGRAIRTHRWKYAVTAPGLSGTAAPGASTYVESHLYDIETDPYELNNLVGKAAYRELSDQLAARLAARIVGAGEEPATIVPAPAIPTGQAYLTEAELRA
ncbi:MAG TPA: sulfatase-like hydrolase/transferase [Thermomicrobiales bacterium]|nr:sulfatase-like hydrolase/transferase [Thermomicrobiales bacterium]